MKAVLEQGNIVLSLFEGEPVGHKNVARVAEGGGPNLFPCECALVLYTVLSMTLDTEYVTSWRTCHALSSSLT